MPEIYAISDPHLSLAKDKPMHIFGDNWIDHPEKIAQNWKKIVKEKDIVLIPGDISWAMNLKDAMIDLEWIEKLPGKKVLIKGNHDYWWESINKVKNACIEYKSLNFVQNNSVVIDDVAIGGSRMWDFPGIYWKYVENKKNNLENKNKKNKPENSEKVAERELERLKNSLESIPKNAKIKIAMLHYPPFAETAEKTKITDVIKNYNIDVCVYGHLHSIDREKKLPTDIVMDNTRYILTSCDYLDFIPKKCLND